MPNRPVACLDWVQIFSSWDEGNHWTDLAPEGWTVDVAQPSTGLFITGTLDGVAEFNDVTAVLNGNQ